ncbi:hypothetical protein CHS0354_035535, partial [Potamilus streckersoni]
MALNEFDSVDKDDLCDVFSSYEARIILTKDNIKKLARIISHPHIMPTKDFRKL